MHRLEGREDPGDDAVLPGEEFVWSSRMQIAEGWLVERRSVHHASGRELVDHHLDESDLCSGETPIVQEL